MATRATASTLDDAPRRPRVIKPPPPPESEEIPRPRPTSVPLRAAAPPCKSLRELALDTLSAHAELIPTDAVDALDEATAADVVAMDHGETKAHDVHRPALHGVAPRASPTRSPACRPTATATALACRGGRECKDRL